MELYINTASYSDIILELREAKKIIVTKTIIVPHRQAEKLLPTLETLLKKYKKRLVDITKIIVEDRGEGFSSLRIGIATANVLAYALNIPISTPSKASRGIIAPVYSRPPSITKRSEP
jgi:tRNA A37 threonylcarbamoyladenosine modification protein TsaB